MKQTLSLWTNVEIESVDLKPTVACFAQREALQSISIIIATGVRRRELGIPGEAEIVGRGIIESATATRQLFAGKDVCVIGGGDAAVEMHCSCRSLFDRDVGPSRQGSARPPRVH